MLNDLIIAVDPGITGALAVVHGDGAFVGLHDLPTMNRNKTDDKQQINCAALCALLRDVTIGTRSQGWTVRVICERVAAMPSQAGAPGGKRRSMGASSAFIFGRTVGHIECACIAQGWPVEFVMPAEWKKALRLPKDKQAARAHAQLLYPHAPLSKKKDHNRAEALLLAHWYAAKLRHADVTAVPLLRKRGHAV